MPDFRITYEETELREVIVTADTADDARCMVGDFGVSLVNSELIETVSTNVVNVELEEYPEFDDETDTPDDYEELETP